MLTILSDPQNKESFRAIAAGKEGTRRAVRQFMFSRAKDIKKEAIRSIRSDPKTGTVYRNRRLPNGRLKRRHKSSAPGESWANFSGAARKSIGWKVHGMVSFVVGLGVAPQKDKIPEPYGKWLEPGTPKGQMKPRPAILNAIHKTEGAAQAHWDRIIKGELG